MTRLEANQSANKKIKRFGPHACLSVEEAASMLHPPMDARIRWLTEGGFVRNPEGEPFVLWGEVWATVAESARHLVLPEIGPSLTLIDGGRD